MFGEEEVGVEFGLFDEGFDGLFGGGVGGCFEGFELVHDCFFEVAALSFHLFAFGFPLFLHIQNRYINIMAEYDRLPVINQQCFDGG